MQGRKLFPKAYLFLVYMTKHLRLNLLKVELTVTTYRQKQEEHLSVSVEFTHRFKSLQVVNLNNTK